MEKLIDLSLLQYYDENLKDWAIKKFSGGGSTTNVQFTTNSNLPVQGELNILYITEDSIQTWDGTQYVKLSSSNGESTLPDAWEDF